MTHTGIKLDFLIKDPIYSYFELTEIEKKVIKRGIKWGTLLKNDTFCPTI